MRLPAAAKIKHLSAANAQFAGKRRNLLRLHKLVRVGKFCSDDCSCLADTADTARFAAFLVFAVYVEGVAELGQALDELLRKRLTPKKTVTH
jgi:hypothetical protein